jgi:hypothetical protein
METSKKLVALAAVLTFAVFWIGCSDDSSSTPLNSQDDVTEADYVVATEDFTEALVGEEEGMLDVWSETAPGHGETVEWFGRGGFHRLPDSTHHRRFDHDVTIIRTYYDAEGNTYEEYDSLTTVSMDRVLLIEGERGPRMGRSSSFTHWDSMRVEGIAPGEEVRTLNGIGYRNVESEWVSPESDAGRSFAGNYNWVVTNLAHNIDRESFPWPLGGEIAVDVIRNHEGSGPRGEHNRTVEFGFTVSFDGTQYAQITRDDGTIVWVDLVTHIRYDERPEE